MKKMKIDDSVYHLAAASDVARRGILSACPTVIEPICEWVESHVDMSFDHSCSASGLVKLYPYQREILAACDSPSVRQVTIQAGQRLGKSQCWKFSLLKRIHDGGLSGIILYPSLDLAEKTNRDTVKPLLCSLPEVSSDLAMRGNIKKDSYHIPSLSSLLYFMGGQSQVVSLTANWVCLDECDFVEVVNSDAEKKNMSQVKALRLRMQSFRERMMIVCSSPTSYGGTVHSEWKEGSQGEWNMRCLGCGELSPVKQLAFYVDGTKWAGLQWAKDANGRVIEDSIRWVCPKCGRAHTFDEAHEMNERGEFVHLHPEITAHRSFQVGALANPSLWTWAEIAQAQEDATDGDGKKYLANTILGTPYKHVKDGELSLSIEDANRARMRQYPPDLQERLAFIGAGIDQQKSELAGAKYFCSVVRGWDEEGNSYLLSAGTDNTLEDVRNRLTATYFGHRVTFALIDQGGFSNDDTDTLLESLPFLYYYKGTAMKSIGNQLFAPSENQRRLFLVSALSYQVKLLELLYSPPRPKGYRFNLPLGVDKEYFQQLCNVKPNHHMTKDGNGMEYVNWCSTGDARRDFFDAEKMCLASLEIACRHLPARGFFHGHLPAFAARERIIELARLAKTGRNVNNT